MQVENRAEHSAPAYWHSPGIVVGGTHHIDWKLVPLKSQGKYLVARRPDEKRHGGLWEFPGGKVHDGEDTFGAASRELQEELG